MFFKEFKDLRRKPDRRLGLPDLLNFGFLEDDYTIVMKDGARLVRVRMPRSRSEFGQSSRTGCAPGAGQPRLRAVR